MIGYLCIDVAKDTFTATLLTDDQDTPIDEITASFPLNLPGWQFLLETWQA